MGCNTSKDSVPQAEAENKENQEGTGETTEGVNNEKANEENVETPYDSDENIELDDDIESEGYSTV